MSRRAHLLPLTPRRAVSTFGLSVLGLLTANLLPFMVIALQDSVGLGVAEAGAVMTASLLATAVASAATTRLAEGAWRVRLGQTGLLIMVLSYVVAAIDPSAPVTIAAVVLGGVGAGGALAASGAALAALRNPNRMSAANGFVNRGVVTVVLAVVPLVGISTGSVFGVVAAFAAVLLVSVAWLPSAPTIAADDGPPSSSRLRRGRTHGDRRVTIAGLALLAMYALWAVSEDSVWALAGAMGADNAGLTDAGLGLVLSASSAGGLIAAIVLIFIGEKIGRAVPFALLLLLGGALKLTAALTTDATVYTIVLIAWNTAYMAVFLLFIATAAALDANGRFSGPAVGVYLFGSAFSPLFGGWLAETIGYAGFGWVISIISWVLVVPVALVAALSTKREREVQDDVDAPVRDTEDVR